MKRSPFFLLIFFALAALVTQHSLLLATEAPTITVRKGNALNIAFSGIGGSQGGAISKVLSNDLNLAGCFSMQPAQRASFIISGVVAGNVLQGKVTDKSGGTVLSKSYSGDMRSAAHQFCNDVVETLTGHPGIATSKIAFVSNRSGHKEIYIADYDGTNGRQITHDNALNVSPSLSPNANRLAYTGYQSGYADIYLIDLGSGARRRLVKFPGTNSGPRFSPDGDRFACTLSKDGVPALYVIGLQGGVQRITKTRGADSCGTWSPNGQELIYASDAHGAPQLYRISSSGGEGHLVPTGFRSATEPNWSPDGQRVVFNTRSDGEFAVAVLELGSGMARIVAKGQNPVWGPDSRHLLFSTKDSLVLFDTQNGKSTPIISSLGQVTEPAWSRK